MRLILKNLLEEELQKVYDTNDQKALKFFSVHADIDVWHSEQLTTLLKTTQRKTFLSEKGCTKSCLSPMGISGCNATNTHKMHLLNSS